ncbi:EF_hand domain-containing protein [Hexamita inflata]|uniref:EF hand domain-containing protein n=1 Tax=Hexamita inflata TaxID=28002 RepID=A0AA86NIT4_9EUKA|nr:EF hand domain-containing protein [Hexamita inflata]CAI9956810.1 EF hand domain-containing protein [Hexamita inflata]
MNKVQMKRNEIYKDVFNSININKSKGISRDQISLYLNRVFKNIDVDIEHAMGILDVMNITSDAKINVNQFLQFMYIFENAELEQVSSICFYLSDTNFSGKIDKNELRGMFVKLNIPADDENVIEIVNNLGELELDYEQFTEFISALVD